MQVEDLTHLNQANVCNEMVKRIKEQQYTLSVAESCTGGILSGILTDREGASEFFECGFITYSNDSKRKLLNVSRRALSKYGAVSEQVAKQMVAGALKQSDAELALAVTGIAGPTGETKDKPVGTVCFAWGSRKKIQSTTKRFEGKRSQVRYSATLAAMLELTKFLDNQY